MRFFTTVISNDFANIKSETNVMKNKINKDLDYNLYILTD